MAGRVIWHRLAEEDITEAYLYFGADSPDAAERLLDARRYSPSTHTPDRSSGLNEKERDPVRRIILQTGDASDPGRRAPAGDIERLAVAVAEGLGDGGFDGEILFGTSGAPADVGADLLILAHIRRALPEASIVYRAGAAGLDVAGLRALCRGGIRRAELATGGEAVAPEAARLGLPVGTPIAELPGVAEALEARVDGVEVALERRDPWPAGDRFEREHPCPRPYEELALWPSGAAYVCGEQYPSLGDEPQGDWRARPLGDIVSGEAACSFRAGHAAADASLPAPCLTCPSPAEPWLLAHRRRLLGYRMRHRGRRAFVLGNGPSLTRMPLHELAGEITFGCNRIHEAFAPGGGLERVTYFCCSDPHVWSELGRDWRASRAEQAFLRWPDIESADAAAILLPQRDQHHFMKDGWFPRDPAQGLARGKTVLLDLALPLALYMGFDEVVLLGCDFSYDPDADNHFYADRDDPRAIEARRAGHQPPFEEQLQGMRVACEAFERAGRRLVNATPGGGLTVLPRVELGSLLAGSGVTPG